MILRGKKLQAIAICLLLNFIFYVAAPTVSLALTGGPTSPEVGAFTAVGSDELVDLSTGDFNYNIPLLTVPGPNGGYPINLGYQSGATMEQEATWVGLGWNLNVGSINRTVRGLPDDFSGEEIEQEVNFRDNISLGLMYNPSIRKKVLGTEVANADYGRYSLSYSNYTGLGLSYGNDFRFGPFSIGGSLGTRDGLNLSTGITFFNSISYSASFSSANGLSAMNFGFNGNVGSNTTKVRAGLSAGVSFAKPSPIGEIPMNKNVVTTSFSLNHGKYDQVGLEIMGFNFSNFASISKNKVVEFNTSTEKAIDKQSSTNAYGFLYLEKATNNSLTDFHKEGQVTENSPYLPLPILDNDIYSVTGQGVSGSFRAYRGDIPLLNPVQSKIIKTKVGASFSSSPGAAGTALGFGITAGSGRASTSKWGYNSSEDGDLSDISDNINTQNKDELYPKYEPFYFEFLGETKEANDDYYETIGEDNAEKYPLQMQNGISIQGMITKTTGFNSVSKNKDIKTDKTLKRTVRKKQISYLTKKDVLDQNNISKKFKNTYNPASGLSDTNDYQKGNNNHIHAINVYNELGMKYEYALPAYNLTKTEATFAIPNESDLSKTRVDYSTDDLNVTGLNKNSNGRDHYVKKITTPAYPYAYHLTATYSDDYVDLKNDGPTDDDFGYWCKFSYEDIGQNYKWRAPFYGANLIEGNYSDRQGDNEDDKATYSYGEREQFYLKKIETKTHVAIFTTSNRPDARGAYEEHQMSTGIQHGAYSKQLDKIELYSKEDLNTPIKTVHFTYSNTLCDGVDNNASGTGKLTLESLHFTYQNNTKGEKTKYTFEYEATNPDYDFMKNTDRWGNYQTISFATTNEFPYTFQENPNSDLHATGWNLVKIELPSGGHIDIDYESDDYAYVQDKRAARMFKIDGMFKSSETSYYDDFKDDRNYIVFSKMDGSAFQNLAEVEECLAGLDYIYFKSYVYLKKFKGLAGNTDASEYIEGYMKKDASVNPDFWPSSGQTKAYFAINMEKYEKASGLGDIHPIQKSAFQHYHNRADLHSTVVNPLNQILMFKNGPISAYKDNKHYCPNIDNSKYSYVRLNEPNYKKKGGGSRVKSIKVNTGWGETYGQKYSYETLDGKSSGVADYEPFIGSEENAVKYPVNYKGVLDYTSQKGIVQTYAEEPFAESFYPGAQVKYSRIVTENITPQDINPSDTDEISNLGGITVTEFYTSKDFPVYSKKTSNTGPTPHIQTPLRIPYGYDRPQTHMSGYSQGYYIELNDMSGKLKAVSTFSYADRNDLKQSKAKTRVEYIYHTDGTGRISASNVKLLTGDGNFVDGTLGRKEEFYTYCQEDIDYDNNTDISLNSAYSGTVHYVTPVKINDRSIKQRRIFVTNKIIYKTGILKEVRTIDNGRTTISKNLAYDAQTGEALVQVQENDWDAPVYSYNYAGHWKYPALGGKYQNDRVRFKVAGSSPSFSIDGVSAPVTDFLKKGDLLKIESTAGNHQGKEVYVTDIDLVTNTFNAKDLSNTNLLAANDVVFVKESGYKNQQSVKVGSLVSLVNPLDFLYTQDAFAQQFFSDWLSQSNSSYISPCKTWNYTFSGGQQTDDTRDNLTTETYNIPVISGTDTCEVEIVIGPYPYELNYTIDPNSLVKGEGDDYTFQYTLTNGYGTQNGTLSFTCDFACNIDGILHASATELTEDVNYDYGFAGSPEVVTSSQGSNLALAYNDPSTNPYGFGQKNIWKVKRSWVNQVDRKQSTGDTEIDKDGTYETFKFYNWSKDLTYNEGNNWTWTNEMTQYNPYGYDVENKNALDIYSAELYGYNQSVVTAVGANTEYQEFGYDGFETDNNYISGNDFDHVMSGNFENTITANDIDAHTGSYSMFIPLHGGGGTGVTVNQTKPLVSSKEYIVSFWLKKEQASLSNFIVKQGTVTLTLIDNSSLDIIDGWVKKEYKFTTNTTSDPISYTFYGPTLIPGPAYTLIDDLRIHPFNSSMKSFVYDPITLRLIAELDAINHATFYNYDEEGKLVQVKKETERGIFTVQSSRDNIAH